MPDTPKLLSYKPFTQSVLRVDTKSLKEELRNQIEDLEDFSKQKAAIEKQLREKQEKLEAQQATFSELESFSFASLKLANYFYNQIRQEQLQIRNLQSDLRFSKEYMRAEEEKERGLTAFLVRLEPNTASMKWSFKRRLLIVKVVLIFSVRIRREGTLFRGTTVIDGVEFNNSTKEHLGVEDILEVKYSNDGIIGAEELVHPKAPRQNFRFKFETSLLHKEFVEFFSDREQIKHNLELQCEELKREVDILNSRVEFLTERQVELEFEAQERSGTVEIQKFAELHAGSIALQQELNAERQERLELEALTQQQEEDILRLKQVINQQQEFALQNQEYAHRIIELENSLCEAHMLKQATHPIEEVSNVNHKQKIRALAAEAEDNDSDVLLSEMLDRTRARMPFGKLERLKNQYIPK